MTAHPVEQLADRRLLLVHAHPDDESSKFAATAARYVDEGARVVLVTCTGGEAGDVLNPAFQLDGVIAAVRKLELECACEAIGFSQRYDLGFEDSGWHEDPADVPEGTFASLPVDVPASALAEVLRRERPQVVVTYPEDGGYPHPDHIMVHRITIAAVDLAASAEADVPGEPWRVAKLYSGTGFPYERTKVLHEAIVARGGESPFAEWTEDRPASAFARIDARIHVAPWFARRDAALRCHASQIDPDGFWFLVPRDLEGELFPWECYTLLGPAPEEEEHDLFAGIA